jgi:hypothetical protein
MVTNDVEPFVAVNDARVLDLFFAAVPGNVTINALVSYYYLSGQETILRKWKERGRIRRLLLDSGAYSAFKSGKSVDIQQYKGCSDLDVRPEGGLFDDWFNLDDSARDYRHNQRNQAILEADWEARGVTRPIPVVHDPEDPVGEFEQYVCEGHDYIALGSDPRLKRDALWAIYEVILRHSPRPIRVHLFGEINVGLLREFRFDSADSATFQHKPRFGCIRYWDTAAQQQVKIWTEGREYNNTGTETLSQWHGKDRFLGFLRETFADEHGPYEWYRVVADIRKQWVVGIYFYYALEQYLNSTAGR